MTSQWTRWRLRSPASRLFTQPFIRARIKENIKAPRHWPLCGEFTGEFSTQMASNEENVSIWWRHHVMGAMASLINGVSIVCSAVCPGADQRKHQSSASLAFVRSPVNSPHKGQWRGKCFHLMTSSCSQNRTTWNSQGNVWTYVNGTCLYSLDIFQYAIFEVWIVTMNALINHLDAFDVTALLVIQLKLVNWRDWKTWTLICLIHS